MVKIRKPWHSGTYQTRQRRLFATIRPSSRCWRCGLLLDEHRPHKDGRPAFWTAGHTVDGDDRAPLALEASTCNFKHGGQRRPNPQRRTLDPEPMRRP